MRGWPLPVVRAGARTVAATLALAGCAHPTSRPPGAALGAHPGGRLVVGIAAPTSLEPSNADGPEAQLVVRTMCDPLIQLDGRTGALRPAITESWLVTDAGRRFTLKLRKGVRFQNGTEVTADDVVYSLSRAASDLAASPLASLLAPIEGFPQVHGDVDVRDESAHRTLRGLRVISKYSLEVDLTGSQADFVRLLTQTVASPVPRHLVEKDPAAFAARPVCAGPYELARAWRAGDPTITLRRSAHYTAVNDGYTAGGRGYADTIEFHIFADKAAELAAFRSGIVDVAHLPRSALPLEAPFSADLVQAPGPSLEYIGLPITAAPFDNHAVRLALSLALDRQAIVDSVMKGAGSPARGFLPSTLGDAHRPAACRDATPASADIAAAQAALARAGVDLRGKILRLNFDDNFLDPGGVDHRALAAAVVIQWQTALGVKVVPVALPWGGYRILARSAEGFDGPFRLSWAAPYPSADGYLAPLFSSATIGSENVSHFSSPPFDRLLSLAARRAGDATDRRLDYQQLEDAVCGELPALPLDFPTTNHLVRRSAIDSARGPLTDLATGDIALRELFFR